MSGVHQFVPALIPRDATGSHTLLLRDALCKAGFESEIYAEATHDELLGETKPFRSYVSSPGDVLIYQFSTSSEVATYLLGRTEPLILDYHNVTRPELSGGWDLPAAARSALALEQLDRLAPHSVLGLCDSHFNAGDLVAAGCKKISVVPVLVDLERLGAPEPRVVERLLTLKSKGGSDWLFVGRCVPPKSQHKLIESLWWYRNKLGCDGRLHLVGGTSSRTYLRALRNFSLELGVSDAVRIWGEVSDEALAAHFAHADVYVSASLHEGFGIPLIEAMSQGVPVVAAAQAAIPETVDSAGLLLTHATPLSLAMGVKKVLSDEGLRNRLVARGRERAAELAHRASADPYIDAIANIVRANGGVR